MSENKVPDLYILKCYCHSFHLVTSHACQTQSKTAEQLIHDEYNYFANSPIRKKSLEEFQHFVDVDYTKPKAMSDSLAFSRNMCFTSSATVASFGAIFYSRSIGDKVFTSLKSPPSSKVTLRKGNFAVHGVCS